MTCRLAFVLVAALGCDASLGGGGGGGSNLDDAGPGSGTLDAAVVPIDAPIDARVCAGGGTLAPDGSCLLHVTTPVTYQQAKTACANLQPGGHLAYLKNAAIDMFAETFIGAVDTWIGGNDLATEMMFVWDDGTPFAFTNWGNGEPNNGNNGGYQEDCVIVAGTRATKQWDDRPCDASEVPSSGTFAYLCQY